MTWVIRRRHLPRNPRSAAARVVVPRLRQLSDETVVANLKLQRRTESFIPSALKGEGRRGKPNLDEARNE